MGNYKCQRPIHPGELLKEEVGNRKLPQTKLAAQTGISYKVLNDILNCRRPSQHLQHCSLKQPWESVPAC